MKKSSSPWLLAALLGTLMPGLALADPQIDTLAGADAPKARFSPRLEQAADGGSELVLDARIAPGWILYASDFEQPEIGPRAARIALTDAGTEGGLRSIASHEGHGQSFIGAYRYTYFSDSGELRQSLPAGTKAVKGTVQAQVCFEESGLCELVRQEIAAH